MYYRPYYDDFERQTTALINVNYPPPLPIPPPVNAPYYVWKKYWKNYWKFYNWWRTNNY